MDVLTGPLNRIPRSYARGVGAALGALLLLAQPSLVLADAYSPTVNRIVWTPTGEPETDYCARSGIVTTARNYAQVLAYVNGGGAHDCVGTANTLPSGWIGTRAGGYRDGVWCGVSGWHYSSQAATNWQLWVTMCSNPSGIQEFKTRGDITIYTGSGYVSNTGPTSPAQNY